MTELTPLRGMDRSGLPLGLIIIGLAWALAAVTIPSSESTRWLSAVAGLGEASIFIGAAVLIQLDPHRLWIDKKSGSYHFDRSPRQIERMKAEMARRTRRLLAASTLLAAVSVTAGITRTVLAVASEHEHVVPHLLVLALVMATAWLVVDIHANELDESQAGQLAPLIRSHRRLRHRVRQVTG